MNSDVESLNLTPTSYLTKTNSNHEPPPGGFFMDTKMTDNVNHPDHYARFRFSCEPKDLTKFLPHPLASAIEYIIRAPFKGSELEDLQKARFWLLEFCNTQKFWRKADDSDDSSSFCCIEESYSPELVASAYAICGKNFFLRNALLPSTFTPASFPQSLYKWQVLRLIVDINSRIEIIESESKPSE